MLTITEAANPVFPKSINYKTDRNQSLPVFGLHVKRTERRSWACRIMIFVSRKWGFEASFSKIYDVIVVPLLEKYRRKIFSLQPRRGEAHGSVEQNYRKNRPK